MTGCAGAPATVHTASDIHALRVIGSDLVWSQSATTDGGTTSELWKCAMNACVPAPFYSPAERFTVFRGAHDDKDVYVSTVKENEYTRVHRASLDGKGEIIATMSGRVFGFLVSGKYGVWLQQPFSPLYPEEHPSNAFGLHRCALTDGCQGELLRVADARFLGASATDILWTPVTPFLSGEDLYRLPLESPPVDGGIDGGFPKDGLGGKFASSMSVQAMVIDATHVYFATVTQDTQFVGPYTLKRVNH